jgi:hypothetical protein
MFGFRRKIKLELRLDVPENLIGYYFYCKIKNKRWSVVDFSWLKDKNHIKYYIEGNYIFWEAMDDNNIIREETLYKLLQRLTP